MTQQISRSSRVWNVISIWHWQQDWHVYVIWSTTGSCRIRERASSSFIRNGLAYVIYCLTKTPREESSFNGSSRNLTCFIQTENSFCAFHKETAFAHFPELNGILSQLRTVLFQISCNISLSFIAELTKFGIFVTSNKRNVCLHYQWNKLIKVPWFLIKHHAAKTYRGLEV